MNQYKDYKEPDFKDTAILQDFENGMYLDPVKPGVRFINFLIDRIVLLGIIYVIMFVWAAVTGDTVATIKDSIFGKDPIEGMLIDFLITAVLTIIYYTISEGISNGRTIGKMVTGTTAIREDGVKFTLRDAFMRSLCRVIPFEPFSAFGYRPWHDSISKTAVVKKVW